MFKDLAYLVEKIRAADFLDEPFRHLYVENFFSDEDFKEITTAPQVALKPAQSDADLITMLHGNGFKEIEFPGTTTNLDAYLSWHKHRNSKRHLNIETCEGFGVTMRLKQYPPNSTLSRFNAFFNSPVWVSMLHEKFGLESAATKTDNGLQKYLDGYEISPHPDIRQKALTYMININPSASSEKLYFHTHYLRFTSEWKYIEEYWRGHPEHDRCWVPWDWCESVKIQTRNNSIVMFSPSDSTLHAIRTSYDHLSTQRTQFYGNLWYRTSNTTGKPNWRDFQVNPTPERLAQRTLKSYIHGLLPTPAVKAIKRFVAKQ